MSVTPEALARMDQAFSAYQAAVAALAAEASVDTVTILTTPAGRTALVRTADGHRLYPIEADVTATG